MLSTRDTTREVAALTVAVEDLRTSAPPLDDQIVHFQPMRIVKAMDEVGDVYYSITPQVEVGFIRSSKSEYPARITKVELQGIDALKSFCERGPAYQYRDQDLWAEAVRFAAEQELDGNACLTLSRSLSVALLIRRGVSNVSARDLP